MQHQHQITVGQHSVNVEFIGRKKKAPPRHVEPVVGPNGEFQEPDIDNNGGQALIGVYAGQVLLTRYARERGWSLYRDICFGRVPGVEADPKYWRIYELLRQRRDAGKLPARDALAPEKIYHPEVLRRRKGRIGGYERYSEAEFEAALEEFGVQVDADEVAAPAAEHVDDDGAELEDLLDMKPGKKGKR